eukprot:gene12461-16714_t
MLFSIISTVLIILLLLSGVDSIGFVSKGSSHISHREDIVSHGRAASNSIHQVTFAIEQKNLDILSEILDKISDPENPDYTKYLSRSEVASLTSNLDSTKYVTDYLSRNDEIVITKISLHGEYIQASAPVRVWEKMFDTTFHSFHHQAKSNIRFLRTNKYSLPIELVDHVQTVFETVQFPAPLAFNSVQTQQTDSTSSVTPNLLKSFYGIQNFFHDTVSQAVLATLNNSFSPSDLTSFQQKFSLASTPVTTVIGGHAYNEACLFQEGARCQEANLDVQYIKAVAQNISTTFIYVDESDLWTKWLTSVAEMSSPPSVISISYGNYEQDISTSYIRPFSIEAQKLAVQGVTILAASGDYGTAYFTPSTSTKTCGFYPIFPASNPFVTAVGGTEIDPQTSIEVAAFNNIASGGGVSNFYRVPSYQKALVEQYFSSQEVSYYEGGRSYPDLSALAVNYETIQNGQSVFVSGTSASTPVIAGMISLVNANRAAKGLPSLGWINPALYKYYSKFTNDITIGNNLCNNNDCCDGQGYSASPGWDPVTGLGSISYTDFLSVFTNTTTQVKFNSSTDAPAANIPSAEPTSSPVVGNEILFSTWVYKSIYNQFTCNGKVLSVTAYPVDVCLPVQYNVRTFATKYRKFTCFGDGIKESFYYDSKCNDLINVNSISYECDAVEETYSYASSEFLSSNYQCSQSDYSSLVPTNDLYYISNITFSELTQCNTIKEVSLYLEGYCFNTRDSLAENNLNSYKFVTNPSPQYQFFNSTGCEFNSNIDSNSLFIGQCRSYDGSLPTRFGVEKTGSTIEPTFLPSAVPTLNPTDYPITFKLLSEKLILKSLGSNFSYAMIDIYNENYYLLNSIKNQVIKVDIDTNTPELIVGLADGNIITKAPTAIPTFKPSFSPTSAVGAWAVANTGIADKFFQSIASTKTGSILAACVMDDDSAGGRGGVYIAGPDRVWTQVYMYSNNGGTCYVTANSDFSAVIVAFAGPDGQAVLISCRNDPTFLTWNFYDTYYTAHINFLTAISIDSAPCPIGCPYDNLFVFLSDATVVWIQENIGSVIVLPIGVKVTSVGIDKHDKRYITTTIGIYSFFSVPDGEGVTYVVDYIGDAPTFEWKSVAVSKDGTIIIAVAYNDGIWKSSDSGFTYSKTNAPDFYWTGISCNSDCSLAIAIKFIGSIYISYDYGDNWILNYDDPSVTNKNLNSVTCSKDFSVLAVAQGYNLAGNILLSTFYSAAPTSTPTDLIPYTFSESPNLNYLLVEASKAFGGVASSLNGNNVIACKIEQFNSKIFRSIDGGFHWSILYSDDIGYISSGFTGFLQCFVSVIANGDAFIVAFNYGNLVYSFDGVSTNVLAAADYPEYSPWTSVHISGATTAVSTSIVFYAFGGTDIINTPYLRISQSSTGTISSISQNALLLSLTSGSEIGSSVNITGSTDGGSYVYLSTAVGLFRSDSYGNAFTKVESFSLGTDAFTIIKSSSNANNVIVLVNRYRSSEILLSTDFGVTYNSVLNDTVHLVGSCISNDGQSMLAITEDDNSGYIVVSKDGGENWVFQSINFSGLERFEDSCIPYAGDGILVRAITCDDTLTKVVVALSDGQFCGNLIYSPARFEPSFEPTFDPTFAPTSYPTLTFDPTFTPTSKPSIFYYPSTDP